MTLWKNPSIRSIKPKLNPYPLVSFAYSSQTKPNTVTMVADMSYSTVSSVIDSWEEIRRLPSYEEKTGVMLFQK
jgi:hypothetical protein